MDVGTEVSAETGLRAAEKLQSVLDGRDKGIDIARMRVELVELGRIIEAVRSVVPHGGSAEKLDEREHQPEALDVGVDALDEVDDGYDPTEFAGEDDDF